MKWSHAFGFLLVGATLSLSAVGCADPDSAPAPGPAQEGDINKGTPLSDAQLKTKLEQLVVGTDFRSETDEPYHVVEGDAVKGSILAGAAVRRSLEKSIRVALKDQISGMDPDFSKLRVDKESVQDWLKGVKEGAADASEDKEMRESDRKVAEALQLMLDQLKNVSGFAYGRDPESGDGSIVFVFVGRSKTTGRLIGLTTFAAFT